jgi:glycosyltransferase involved in cell wall biosynthesis
MPYWFSIVILTSNEELRIARCIKAANQLSDDILVLLNNCSDNTKQVALAAGARVVDIAWQGYGTTKNQGHSIALYPWILSLDADEYISESLHAQIKQITFPENEQYVYSVKRVLNWHGRDLLHGDSVEWKARLFHRDFAYWSTHRAHEILLYRDKPHFIKLKGTLAHHSYTDGGDAVLKMEKYARGIAEQYHEKGKQSSASGAKWRAKWSFIRAYFIKLGFLDGKVGRMHAQLIHDYTLYKYNYLAKLNNNAPQNETS